MNVRHARTAAYVKPSRIREALARTLSEGLAYDAHKGRDVAREEPSARNLTNKACDDGNDVGDEGNDVGDDTDDCEKGYDADNCEKGYNKRRSARGRQREEGEEEEAHLAPVAAPNNKSHPRPGGVEIRIRCDDGTNPVRRRYTSGTAIVLADSF
ncbi:hypothetical protein K523DRAFT_349616 [Schizophyllum commune Tattone D]|nr:hypothetical protein K523DRAFT_349616 [Schizophyllum commune Tattone D]